MQSNQPAMVYLKELRSWLDRHPREVVVIWFSKHGDSCRTDQYDVTHAQKQKWWKQVEQLFSGLLFDRSEGREVNSTSLNDLITVGQRVIAYVSDWQNFTNGSPRAYDACTYLSNTLGSCIEGAPGSNEEAALLSEL